LILLKVRNVNMTYCIPKPELNEFIKALEDGRISSRGLVDMTSAQRSAFLAEIVGKENSSSINALLEQGLIKKNYIKGVENALKTIKDGKKVNKKDLHDRIKQVEEWTDFDPAKRAEFLQDVASQKLGFKTSFEDAKMLGEMSARVRSTEQAIPEGALPRSKEVIDHGLAVVDFRDVVGRMRGQEDIIQMFKDKPIVETAGLSKSLRAAWDASFTFRQGIKMMARHPITWSKAVVDIHKAMVKEVGLRSILTGKEGPNMMRYIEADVASRTMARNGKFDQYGIEMRVGPEEGMPSHVPARLADVKTPILGIPFRAVGRLFKASETAFNGMAIRMRADLGEIVINRVEGKTKHFLETRRNFNPEMDPKGAKNIGQLVNAMTGRGRVSFGKDGAFGVDAVNSTLFSIKFFKSNIETLTAHGYINPLKSMKPTQGFRKLTEAEHIVRRQALENIASIVSLQVLIHTMSEILQPGSTEKDLRNANFGRIKIGNTRFDTTGGMASLAVVIARLTPTKHNGEWGQWQQSSTSGKWVNMWDKQYGQRDGFELFSDFIGNKLSPFAAVFRDIGSGLEHFGGVPMTPTSVLIRTTTPIGVETWSDLQDPDAAPWLLGMLAEFWGIGNNTY